MALQDEWVLQLEADGVPRATGGRREYDEGEDSEAGVWGCLMVKA